MEAALAARGDCLPTAGKALTGAGAGAGRAGAALLTGAGVLPGATLAAGALAEEAGLFFTMGLAALDAGLAATLDAGLAWTGTGLPLALALEGVVLAAGADFWATGLLAVLAPPFPGGGFFLVFFFGGVRAFVLKRKDGWRQRMGSGRRIDWYIVHEGFSHAKRHCAALNGADWFFPGRTILLKKVCDSQQTAPMASGHEKPWKT